MQLSFVKSQASSLALAEKVSLGEATRDLKTFPQKHSYFEDLE
jgi:hypothetical protein